MPPDNGQYLYVAYTIAGVVYLAYAVRLLLKARR